MVNSTRSSTYVCIILPRALSELPVSQIKTDSPSLACGLKQSYRGDLIHPLTSVLLNQH